MKTVKTLVKTKYPALIWTIIIFILCTLPSKELPKVNDKTAHFVVFAIFAFLWLIPTRKSWLVLVAGAIYGLFIEFWQGILPVHFHRSYDLYDALADCIGTIIGFIAWKFLDRFQII